MNNIKSQLLKRWSELLDQMELNHDCHLSAEDGCEGCEQIYKLRQQIKYEPRMERTLAQDRQEGN